MIKFFIILITILALALPVCADTTFYESYENFNIGAKNIFDRNSPDLWTPNCNSANYYEIVGSPVRAGNQAIKFYNHRVSKSDGYRCENAAWAGRGSGHARYFTIGEEHWLGFSIYLPVDFVCDGCEKPNYNNEIHGQIHASPDRKSNRRPGYDDEAWRNPPISLSIKEDNWRITIRSDSTPVTVNKNYDRNKLYVIGSWLGDKGKWTDWVFHFKLDYTKNGDKGGFFRVYKNGILVVDDTGGNCYNDLMGPYFAFGTYKHSWKNGPTDTDTRTVYYDEIKVGDKYSNLSEVSPDGTGGEPLSKPLPAPSSSTCTLDAKFQETTLNNEIKYYTDRTYTLTSIPSEYVDMGLIKTPNDERNLTTEKNYLTFELSKDVTVYVAFDSRATSLPDWMSGFSNTGDRIHTSLSSQPYLKVYSKSYSDGACVNIGANQAAGFSGSGSNYIVFYGTGDGSSTKSLPPPSPSTSTLDAKFQKATLLNNGNEYYTDRTYTLTSIPSEYVDMGLIKTPNDERNLTTEKNYLTFELSKDVTVYVAFDSRATSLPDWMSGFSNTGDRIYTSLSSQPYLKVYSRSYSAGDFVNLGASKATGFSGNTVSNYIVFYYTVSAPKGFGKKEES